MNFLEKFIADKISNRADDWARIVDAGEIVRRYISPALPKTIDQFKPADVVGLIDYGESDRSRATSVQITFNPRDLSDTKAIDIAYGTISKVATGLQKTGWSVDSLPTIEAHNWNDGMYITLKAERTIPERKRFFRSPILKRTIPLSIVFSSMPETERCRIVESVEQVPATTRKVRKVVCEDPESVAGIIQSPALPHNTRRS